MLMSIRTIIKVTPEQESLLSFMCLAASKLWNICNYERRHWEELGLEEYPNWYVQKKNHKTDDWYRMLPSQTAQETCKQLDKSWKSFFVLQKTKGVENPRPPRYKKDPVCITYMQNGIRHEKESSGIRLTLSGNLKAHMSSACDIHVQFLSLENKIFRRMEVIKQIKLYPPRRGECETIVIYEIPDPELLPDNGRYLSVDLGLHNLMTCYPNTGAPSFIVGRKYLSICSKYNKETARVQAQWSGYQSRKGIQHPKSSRHIRNLYRKRTDTIRDYLHKCTRAVVKYCEENDIHTVVIGDWRNIRKNANLGSITNQKLHALPFRQMYQLLEYKLLLSGIRLVKHSEAYSSQCGPDTPAVAEQYADKRNRVKRGLFVSCEVSYNADALGAYNILRKYASDTGINLETPIQGIMTTTMLKVAV